MNCGDNIEHYAHDVWRRLEFVNETLTAAIVGRESRAFATKCDDLFFLDRVEFA
jgi:hypothetical protein